ncbi:MAG TPA: hypothetical protein VLB84_12330 [Bacteroidia bacterium]|jgi:hypothetical protein|nr:hypothetical protein [Bacteroidia bacterium]
MKHEEILAPKIRLKAYSPREVAELYDISNRILKKWLVPFEDEIGARIGHYYSPKQMKVIFEKLGIPHVAQFK